MKRNKHFSMKTVSEAKVESTVWNEKESQARLKNRRNEKKKTFQPLNNNKFLVFSCIANFACFANFLLPTPNVRVNWFVSGFSPLTAKQNKVWCSLLLCLLASSAALTIATSSLHRLNFRQCSDWRMVDVFCCNICNCAFNSRSLAQYL